MEKVIKILKIKYLLFNFNSESEKNLFNYIFQMNRKTLNISTFLFNLNSEKEFHKV